MVQTSIGIEYGSLGPGLDLGGGAARDGQPSMHVYMYGTVHILVAYMYALDAGVFVGQPVRGLYGSSRIKCTACARPCSSLVAHNRYVSCGTHAHTHAHAHAHAHARPQPPATATTGARQMTKER